MTLWTNKQLNIDDLKDQRHELIKQISKLTARIHELEAGSEEKKRIEVDMPVSIDVIRYKDEDGVWSKWKMLGIIPPSVEDAQVVVNLRERGE